MSEADEISAAFDAQVRTWGTTETHDGVLLGYNVSPEMLREMRAMVRSFVADLENR